MYLHHSQNREQPITKMSKSKSSKLVQQKNTHGSIPRGPNKKQQGSRPGEGVREHHPVGNHTIEVEPSFRTGTQRTGQLQKNVVGAANPQKLHKS